MKNMYVALVVVLCGVTVERAVAGCISCSGDVGVMKTAKKIWGTPSSPDNSTHTHDFGALCDSVNLASSLGEVYITISVLGDLEGTTKYMTANFISGGNTTAITSGNNFIGAPLAGRLFKNNGVTSCGGEKNSITVQLDYDDFNQLLANGDGTMKIELIASSAVEDLCDICCDTGQSWTPDACCTDSPPCSCPPNVESRSEVILIYLDCDVVGDTSQCAINADCDDRLYCTGTETCQDGLCVATGNPCLASGKLCKEAGDTCINCVLDSQCRDEDGQFCNGDETCVSGTCTAASNPCTSGQTCNEKTDVCVDPPTTSGTGCP